MRMYGMVCTCCTRGARLVARLDEGTVAQRDLVEEEGRPGVDVLGQQHAHTQEAESENLGRVYDVCTTCVRRV